MRNNGFRRHLKIVAGALCTLSAGLLIVNELAAKDSRVKVKASAAVGAIDAAGKQTVTVTFVVDPTWHIYANPAKNETFDTIATKVDFLVGGKAAKASVSYPAGKFYRDPGDPKLTCMIYEGKVDIQAVVQRTPGDTSALDVEVFFSACDAKNCYLPAQLRLNKENGFSHVPKK